jgi:hypothetical protein
MARVWAGWSAVVSIPSEPCVGYERPHGTDGSNTADGTGGV